MPCHEGPGLIEAPVGVKIAAMLRAVISRPIASLGCDHPVHQCVPACRAIEVESMPSLQMVTRRTGNQEVVVWRNPQGGNVVDLGPLGTDDAVRDALGYGVDGCWYRHCSQSQV
jgi:hypothetical protein